jgi:hypothetical protein
VPPTRPTLNDGSLTCLGYCPSRPTLVVYKRHTHHLRLMWAFLRR